MDVNKGLSINLRASGEAEREKAVKYLRSNGFTVDSRTDSQATYFDYIYPDPDKLESNDPDFRYGCNLSNRSGIPEYVKETNMLILPQDWDALVEWVDANKKQEVHPKDGEVWEFTYKDEARDWVLRINTKKNHDYQKHYTMLSGWKNEFYGDNDSIGLDGLISKAKLEGQELQDHIDLEHKNGYHWDGKKLIKLPEYVRIIEGQEGCNYDRTSKNYHGLTHYDEDCEIKAFKVTDFYFNNNANQCYVIEGIIEDNTVCFDFDAVEEITQKEFETQQKEIELQKFKNSMVQDEICQLESFCYTWTFRFKEFRERYVDNYAAATLHDGYISCTEGRLEPIKESLKATTKEQKLEFIKLECKKGVIWDQSTKSYK